MTAEERKAAVDKEKADGALQLAAALAVGGDWRAFRTEMSCLACSDGPLYFLMETKVVCNYCFLVERRC